ncbi:MAG: hypothetical protein KA314_01195 [Chloroflexi bacterium]|nr:hypothetical protein [Chloroflexota bacterium]MBP8054422.1 hypothetical protein [Chloroflexota bacterium]
MSTEQERTKILEMLAQGTITADEAVNLLEKPVPAAANPAPTPDFPQAPAEKRFTNGQQPRWLHIRIGNLESGKDRVKVKIPFRLMRWGLKLGSKFTDELDDLDIEELIKGLHDGDDGMLVDVQDEDDGEHVQIYVE